MVRDEASPGWANTLPGPPRGTPPWVRGLLRELLATLPVNAATALIEGHRCDRDAIMAAAASLPDAQVLVWGPAKPRTQTGSENGGGRLIWQGGAGRPVIQATTDRYSATD